MLVDLHVHDSPKALRPCDGTLRGCGPLGPSGQPTPHTTSAEPVAYRLELMAEAGVDLQVLSHGATGPDLNSEHGLVDAAARATTATASGNRRSAARTSSRS